MNDSKKITTLHYFLIFLNIVSFVFLHYLNKNDDLVYSFLLNKNSMELPISFLLNGFSHANIPHILMNIYFLFMANKVFSQIFTFKESVRFFFTSFVLSTLIVYFILVCFNLDINVLGASGWLFAYLGYFLCLLEKNKIIKNIIINIVIHIAVILLGVNIAWYAHLAGFAVGVSYYFCIYRYSPVNNLL
jgi:membrane associated rhomboid family serine protease